MSGNPIQCEQKNGLLLRRTRETSTPPKKPVLSFRVEKASRGCASSTKRMERHTNTFKMSHIVCACCFDGQLLLNISALLPNRPMRTLPCRIDSIQTEHNERQFISSFVLCALYSRTSTRIHSFVKTSISVQLENTARPSAISLCNVERTETDLFRRFFIEFCSFLRCPVDMIFKGNKQEQMEGKFLPQFRFINFSCVNKYRFSFQLNIIVWCRKHVNSTLI